MAIEVLPDPQEQEALDSYSTLIVTVAERVLPSVASIQVRRGGGERGGGSGSAVALTPDGFLVTSAHVVAGAAQGRAAFIDGRELPIDVVGADPLSDLAVVRARAGGGLAGQCRAARSRSRSFPRSCAAVASAAPTSASRAANGRCRPSTRAASAAGRRSRSPRWWPAARPPAPACAPAT